MTETDPHEQTGVLESQPELDKSAGIAKLVGRPSASDAPETTPEYDASGGEVDEGEGVLSSQPATFNA